MRTSLLVLLLLTSVASASESVWRWVDSDGVTHYSDRPVPGATKVELRSVNQMNTAGATTASPAAADTPPTPAAVENYNAFEISSPAPEQSIINTGGQVSISLRVDPSLRPGHTVVVVLDGQPVPGSPGTGLQYIAKDVPRGEHNIAAVITDPSGRQVATAASVRFYVRQATVRGDLPSNRVNTPQRPNPSTNPANPAIPPRTTR
jgi:hypothetical protein